jgi:hypothetical protein
VKAVATLIVPLAAAALVAGCSGATNGKGGAKSTGRGGPTATTAAPASSSAPGATPPDQAKLQSLLLASADVPSGWTASPGSDDNTPDDSDARIAACIGIPNTEAVQVAQASSGDFTHGESTISSSANSYRSQDVLDRVEQSLLGPKATPCFEQEFQRTMSTELPGGAKIDSFDLTISPGPGGGPSDVVATAAGKVSIFASGQRVTIYLDVAFIKGDLVGADVDFVGFGQRIGADVQRKAIDAVANRVAAG